MKLVRMSSVLYERLIVIVFRVDAILVSRSIPFCPWR